MENNGKAPISTISVINPFSYSPSSSFSSSSSSSPPSQCSSSGFASPTSLASPEKSHQVFPTPPPSPSPPPPPPPALASPTTPVVLSPCAACKILRRRCVEKCVFAPYFPPTEPYKFTIAHRVFGASNIIKSLKELPESQRADAVSSIVYEASARIRDPVYGCAGAICQLQKEVSKLQAQLAKAQAEIVTMQCQQSNLLAFILEMAPSREATITISRQQQQQQQQPYSIDTTCFLDDNNLASAWEPLWT